MAPVFEPPGDGVECLGAPRRRLCASDSTFCEHPGRGPRGRRHLQVLELVLEGCSNQEISTATELSLGTVKNYVSAILLALDVHPGELLPVDDSGYGFDNIGDVLSFSPALLERYMSAARRVSRTAIGDLAILKEDNRYPRCGWPGSTPGWTGPSIPRRASVT